MNKQEKKFIRDLHHPKTRRPTGRCIVEGVRALSTFMQSSHQLEQLYVSPKGLLHLDQLPYMVDYLDLDEETMQSISAASTASGLLAIFKINTATQPLGPGIVCARLQDPGNVGTLIRTAAALAKKTVVFVESVDPWSPKVIQASAGTIAQMEVHELSWSELRIHAGNTPLYALVTQQGERPTPAHADGLFVIGNEAQGIPQEWVKDCTKKITLPMPGNTESLNAAIAGSIALYMTLLFE